MENKIYITDDGGNEREMNILFTFDMNDKNYVVVYENDNDEELENVQEVIDAFDGIDDEEKED